uniref:Proteophosphoglycan ppg4 n=1 Tax=Mycena chlorophos TaxID=658473 RepID=A0ABQ0KZW0_MYCCL|nr:predicted protein [Mycena chlorophos]
MYGNGGVDANQISRPTLVSQSCDHTPSFLYARRRCSTRCERIWFRIISGSDLACRSSKERNGVQLPPASSGDGRSGASSLRAKIAAFESQGAVPAPRGSFGMGAPPEPKPRQRAELYGNVMQPSRLPSATLGLARPVEAFSSLDPRAIALPADDSGLYSEPSGPVARSSLPSDASRIPSNGSGRNAPNPFAFEELMRKARAPETAPVTAAAKAVQEKHRQPAVTTRATDFSKALEKARRAEADAKATRRQSALFLQPQFTGSTLTPQHTGGSGPLSPQHTGGSFIIAPQTTGGSTRPFSPPPLSPLAAYSPPRSPSSPKLTTPTSATRPLSAFFAVEDRPLVAEPQEVDETTEIDPEAPSPHQPLSAEADVPAEQADPSPAPLEEKTPPPTGPPSEPDQTLEEVLEPEPVLLETSEPEPNSVVIQDPMPSSERAEEVAPAVDEGNAEHQACVTAATPVETKALESASDDEPHHHPSSPDSFHAGLDLDAHLRRHALTGESHAVQSAFDDDEDEPVYSLGEDELAPLPNNLASHRFRAHLSTITERSIEPGSPSWDVSRFSMASSAWGDRRASRRESDGYGAVFEYIYEGRDVEDEEASGPDLDSPVAAGMAGIGAGANAVVETSESPSAPTPPDSDYVVLRADRRDSTGYKDDGPPSPSPYRLSYLTDRGYTPSLRSEDGDRAEDSGAWPEEQQPEPEVQTPVPANFHPDVSSMDLGPKSPGMDGVFGAPPPAGQDPASPDETPVADSIRNSLLSTRDSLLSIPRDSMSSTRDSMLSTRDSILSIDSRNSAASAAHAQVVTLRPLSTLSSLDTASPSHVAVAHRIPAVAGVQGFQRGVAVYVPGNLKGSAEEPAPTPRRRNLPLAPRPSTTYEVTPNTTPPRRPALTAAGLPRPHTAYLPDDDDEGGDSLGEFRTISFGTQPHSFSAVVHGRVRETTEHPKAGPSRHYWDEDKSLPPMPMSPGYATGNDLAELMAEAALLEQRLERGELPAEALRRLSRISMRLPPKVPTGPAPPVPPLPLHQQQQNIAPLKPRRSLRNPLSRSRSDRRPAEVQEDVRPLASSSTSNLLSVAPLTEATLPAPEQVVLLRTSTNSSDIPPTPPPKSPGARYFSSLRRLASTSRNLAVAPTRGSVSTGSELSSEDSMGVQTPPDDHEPALSPTPSTKGITWPSLKSKKSGSSLGKSAASLAGKIWPRTRSKSNNSSSSIDTVPSPPTAPVPALPPPPILRLDPLPPSFEYDDADVTPVSQPPAAQPFSKRPPNLVVQTTGPPLGNDGLLLPVPNTAPESRPASWMSVSSNASSSMTPSPLFDKAIFDAFPSVPAMPGHASRPLPSLSRANSGSSSALDSTASTPSFSERSFGVVGARPNPTATFGRDNLLARVAQTQRSVQPL